MGVQTVKNLTIIAGHVDLSPYKNKFGIAARQEFPDGANFEGGAVSLPSPGMESFEASLEGFLANDGDLTPSSIEEKLWGPDPSGGSSSGGLSGLIVARANPAVAGTRAYVLYGTRGNLELPFELGRLAGLRTSIQQYGWPARGVVLARQVAQAASADGSVVLHTAIPTARRGVAMLAVTATSGAPTLDVIVASDDAIGFASPTTRYTFAQKTAVGWELLSLAGPVTDTYWRASWTFGGTGSITFYVAFGVD